jgi:hypothetical protein
VLPPSRSGGDAIFVHRDVLLAKIARADHTDRATVDPRLSAAAGEVLEIRGLWNLNALVPGGLYDAVGDRVLGVGLQAGGETTQIVLANVAEARDLFHPEAAGG